MRPVFREFRGWFRQHPYLGSALVLGFLATLVFVVTAVVTGVIGNTAYDWIKDWIKSSNGNVTIVWWFLLVVFVLPLLILLLLAGLFSGHLIKQREDAEAALKTSTVAIAKMRAWGLAQFTALRLMAAVRADEGILADDERDFKNLVQAFLDKAVEVFGTHICRAVVLKPIPAPNDRTHLVLWECSKNMNTNLGDPYDVGNEDTEGTAGYVFRTGTMQKGKMICESGIWKCTAPHYRFAPRRNTDPPNYLSLVIAPLEDPDRRRWGVLCLDSKNEGTFDDEELVKVIQDLADGLAAGISTYANFRAAAEEVRKANSDVVMLRKDLQDCLDAKK